MPRRNRPGRARARRLRAEPGTVSGAVSGRPEFESTPDGEWLVRTVPGAQAAKEYRCPGCDHEIRVGVPHVVAWPADETGSVLDRRHWHRTCWEARSRRRPDRRR